MKYAFIYSASPGRAYPFLRKIGCTTDPMKRIKSLNNTSVPNDFTLCNMIAVPFDERYSIENNIHEYFRHLRVRTDREFFRVSDNDVHRIFSLISDMKKLQTIRIVDNSTWEYEIPDVPKKDPKEKIVFTSVQEYLSSGQYKKALDHSINIGSIKMIKKRVPEEEWWGTNNELRGHKLDPYDIESVKFYSSIVRKYDQSLTYRNGELSAGLSRIIKILGNTNL